MPLHLFTFHVFGSFSPEPSAQRELFPAARFEGLCQQLRAEPTLRFDADHQRRLVDAAIDGQQQAGYRCFAVVADHQLVHVLVGWEGDREPDTVRRRLSGLLVEALSAEFGARAWFSELGREKRVRNRTHFDYLVRSFFPKQRGLVWTCASPTRQGPIRRGPRPLGNRLATARKRLPARPAVR